MYQQQLILRLIVSTQRLTYQSDKSDPHDLTRAFSGRSFKLQAQRLGRSHAYTMREAEVLIGRWREHYNTVRPHSSLGYRPPAPEAILPRPAGLSYAALRSAHQGDHKSALHFAVR
ncbi:integrase core domain-containing protein [Tsuneonella sp. CC-YZS046]|uniref:integrase core domain-containing protein n=1 Tax=Tsuneonella sp. CC-YZS046 TaxID=3042152 RepID=UPI003A7F2C4C